MFGWNRKGVGKRKKYTRPRESVDQYGRWLASRVKMTHTRGRKWGG